MNLGTVGFESRGHRLTGSDITAVHFRNNMEGNSVFQKAFMDCMESNSIFQNACFGLLTMVMKLYENNMFYKILIWLKN